MPDHETPYTPAQIDERLQQLPGWHYEGGSIQRVYDTDGWPTRRCWSTRSASARRRRTTIRT